MAIRLITLAATVALASAGPTFAQGPNDRPPGFGGDLGSAGSRQPGTGDVRRALPPVPPPGHVRPGADDTSAPGERNLGHGEMGIGSQMGEPAGNVLAEPADDPVTVRPPLMREDESGIAATNSKLGIGRDPIPATRPNVTGDEAYNVPPGPRDSAKPADWPLSTDPAPDPSAVPDPPR